MIYTKTEEEEKKLTKPPGDVAIASRPSTGSLRP